MRAFLRAGCRGSLKTQSVTQSVTAGGADTESLMSRAYIPFAKGTTGVRALQSIDIAVRHAESFGAMQDAIA